MTKILLVEDDKSLREIYGVRLLAEGYDIVSAGDGEEALALAIKERPNLIISDVMMPKISGFDMLDILRSTTETRTIKVIMMTALSSDDQRRRGEQLGADKYLVKSQVGIEDVVRTVHEVLGDAPISPAGNQNPFDAAKAAPAPQPSSAPTEASLPAPQPQPAPQPPAAPYQTAPTMPAPQPTQPTSGMPQPTAPFSSSTPRPANLGERVIQPLDKPQTSGPDVSEMIDRELSGEQIMPTPFETPMTGETHTDASQPTPAPQPAPEPTPRPDPTPTPAMPEPSAPPATPSPQPKPTMPGPIPQPAPQPQPAPAAPQAPAQPADQSQPSGPIKYEETPLQTPASQPPASPQAPQPPAQPGA